MKKIILALAILLSAGSAFAQQKIDQLHMATTWNMNGLAANAAVYVASANLVDSTNFTIASQPDSCRLVGITITDANSSISAGVLTVTGTDCWDDAQTCTYTFAGGGSGAKVLAYGTGLSQGCNFKTLTTIAVGALTGEDAPGTDLITVGTLAPTNNYPIYGTRERTLQGLRYVNPFLKKAGAGTITINGTALASYASVAGGAFQNISVGDMIYIKVGGVEYERKIVTVTNDDSAAMDLALPASVAPATTKEIGFTFKKFYVLKDATDGWVPMPSEGGAAFIILDVDANTNTGGVVSSMECGYLTSGTFDPNIVIDTDTIASAATGSATTAVDLRLSPYEYCRTGVKFGTNDDAGDTGAEIINIMLVLNRVP